MWISNAYAQAAGALSFEQQIIGFLPIILMFVVFYFLMIRPQMKLNRERLQMIETLKKNGEEIKARQMVEHDLEQRKINRPFQLLLVITFCLSGIPAVFFYDETTGFIGDKGFFVFFFLLISMFLYLLPSFIAVRTNHPYKLPIFVLNLCGGWLVVGWIVAIVWAFMPKKLATTSSENVAHNNAVIPASPPEVQPTDITTQLAKLDDLRNKGVLSNEEFQAAKSKLLN